MNHALTYIMVPLAIVLATNTSRLVTPIATSTECAINPSLCEQELRQGAYLSTNSGELTISYADRKVALTGTLYRVSPCVDWNVYVDRLPSDRKEEVIEFKIFDKHRGEVCLQTAAQFQHVNIKAPATATTSYKLFLEDNLIFSGKLSSSKNPLPITTTEELLINNGYRLQYAKVE